MNVLITLTYKTTKTNKLQVDITKDIVLNTFTLYLTKIDCKTVSSRENIMLEKESNE